MLVFEGAEELRLEDGSGCCAGRVEVKHQGQLGTMCDDSWDMADAAVVCKQLGCRSAVKAPKYRHFGSVSGPIWMDEVHCRGTEYALSDCKQHGRDQHNRNHGRDAGLMCSGFFRLVREDSPCSGCMEIHDGTQWKTVCDSDFAPKAADMVCRELQCGTALSVPRATHFRE
ncbi:PREDICTED: antigen WC1.1-like, partial [Pygoscelis adeliae]|uniref:antigen WC1.1-like n=1 Tax=Pygoscelis adeliae TaxID=9238 RepID=UPI0004F4EF16